MVYIDPPYGIKYGSNFQPFVNKRDVKDKKDEDLTSETEMIKAFRDTWELGIHSYLTYLRDRLLLARELLSDSGSVFVQISDENVHLVRCICDEVFGKENFVAQTVFRTRSTSTTKYLSTLNDYIIWYTKNIDLLKYHQIYENKTPDLDRFNYVEINGEIKNIHSINDIVKNQKVFSSSSMNSTTASSNSENQEFEYNGKKYRPAQSRSWRCSLEGLERLKRANRIFLQGDSLRYKYYYDDFPFIELTNLWVEQLSEQNKQYVVQTAVTAIQRCLLMTTDPGDLVLDITCGSGTTAYVAEQWGRRWITCDTSRIAVTLAKKRLMTATFDYYKLARPEQGVSSGFVYKTVPHITLKSIANNEPPETETLYDQPEIDKTKVRISGPFTVEALPAPVVQPLDTTAEALPTDYAAKLADWRDELLATGIIGRGGAKIEFSRVEPLSGTAYLQAEAETKEETPRRAVICFAGETKPMDSRMIDLALTETESLRPSPKLIVFAAFQFDPEAAKMIDDTKWSGVTCLKAQMNPDLMTDDLKKKRSSNQSFWLVGQPDVELIRIEQGDDKGKYKVKVKGFDYYDAKKGVVESGDTGRIAMWMLDTNYDGMALEPMQVFFPMGGQNDGWNKLAKTLKAEINVELIERYETTESLPFALPDKAMVAVKIIDDRGIESLIALKVSDL
ncbi:MAG: site-specific DNA-methyltransferase [Helicobacteraceae bacterium]|jgi:adenine-specific DNA-methyltransferase|nr:site-specific DNA-methyltransferase [Helicobacteraceae bacterium]